MVRPMRDWLVDSICVATNDGSYIAPEASEIVELECGCWVSYDESLECKNGVCDIHREES